MARVAGGKSLVSRPGNVAGDGRRRRIQRKWMLMGSEEGRKVCEREWGVGVGDGDVRGLSGLINSREARTLHVLNGEVVGVGRIMSSVARRKMEYRCKDGQDSV